MVFWYEAEVETMSVVLDIYFRAFFERMMMYTFMLIINSLMLARTAEGFIQSRTNYLILVTSYCPTKISEAVGENFLICEWRNINGDRR